MTTVRVFFARLLAMLGLGRREEELGEEVQLHLDLLAEEYRRKGFSDEDAQRAARRQFGGVMLVRETYRNQLRFPQIDALVRDVRYAVRLLARDRTASLAAIALLTVGVSAAVLMADMVDRLLLRPPAGVSAPERVARAYDQADGTKLSAMVTNHATVERLATGTTREVESMAAYYTENVGLGRGSEARHASAVTHSRGYFDVLGLTPALGVLPSARGKQFPDTLVISHALWQQQFGGTTDILGRSVRIGKRVYTIVAVAPREFLGTDDEPVDVWLPIETRAADGTLSQNWRTSTGYFMLRVIARLRPGVERAAANSHASCGVQRRSIAAMGRRKAPSLPAHLWRSARGPRAGRFA
jgi:putative ABC transport system permease protein